MNQEKTETILILDKEYFRKEKLYQDKNIKQYFKGHSPRRQKT